MSARDQLARDGFVVQSLDEGESLAFVEGLGSVLDTTEVMLRPNAGTWLTSPEAIPAHTDHPCARWIGWLCRRQDPEDGASILVDGASVLDDLPPRDVEALARVSLVLRGAAVPLLKPDGLFFAPWLDRRAPDRHAREVLASFVSMLEDKRYWQSVRLKPGQLLVVDNGRWLHGRAALSSGSQRHLTRWWVGD